MSTIIVIPLLKKDLNKKIGDLIIFLNIETEEKLIVLVKKITKFNDFYEIYNHFNKIQIGYSENQEAASNYYSKELIDQYGVLAIEMKIY